MKHDSDYHRHEPLPIRQINLVLSFSAPTPDQVSELADRLGISREKAQNGLFELWGWLTEDPSFPISGTLLCYFFDAMPAPIIAALASVEILESPQVSEEEYHRVVGDL